MFFLSVSLITGIWLLYSARRVIRHDLRVIKALYFTEKK